MTGRFASAILLVSLMSYAAHAAPLPDTQALLPIDSRINKTGRPMPLFASVREGGEQLGEIQIVIGADDIITLDRDAVLAVIKPRLEEQALVAFAGLEPRPPLDAFATESVALRFDKSSMELVFEVKNAAAVEQDMPLRRRMPKGSATLPANLSAYLNVTTLLNHTWSEQAGRTGLSFQFDGAARYQGWVLEGEGSLDGPLDSFLCPNEASCSYAHHTGLKRQGTRLVTDFADQHTRLTFGDISYWGNPIQRGNDLAGIALRHEASLYNVNQRLDSATASTLQLDTSADVEVLVNGGPLQRLRLKPGTYRLTDLPLTAGSNDIELIITSDTGERRSVRVKALNHDTMLAPGKSEWTLAAGVPSYMRDQERHYQSDALVANGRYRIGLSSMFTAHVHGQTDTHVTMAGVGVLALTSFGLWGLSLAASSSDTAVGTAGTLSWETLSAPRGEAGRQSLRLQADYRSSMFMTPGDALLTNSGVLFPVYVPALRLSAAWSAELPSSMLATLTGRYAFADIGISEPGEVLAGDDRWGVNASLSMPLPPSLTGTFWVGYGNERLLSFDADPDLRPELQLGVRVSWMPSPNTYVQTETDSLLRQTVASGSMRSGTDANSWTTTVNAAHSELFGTSLAGSVAHHGRFADVVVSHSANARTLNGFDTQYSALRSTTSIAFADGQVGIGPAIRDAFVLVRPHASLSNSLVIVGDPETPKASGSLTWPAMLVNLPSYAESRFALDATDIPVGYSLGSGFLHVDPPYRAGYAIEVGSDSPLTVFGVLLDDHARPVSLASGHATPRDKDAPKVPVFTNSAGRFALEGLAESEWMITLDIPGGHLLYGLVVAKAETALINVGVLRPAVSVEKPDETPPAPVQFRSAALRE